jgi:WD40 repeat protein
LGHSEYVLVATETGKPLFRHSWPRGTDDDSVICLAISPDWGTLARGCYDATVRLCDAASGREKLRFSVGNKAQDQYPHAVQFSADGKAIYVLAKNKASITAYETGTGKPLPTLSRWKISAYYLANYLVSAPNHRLLAAMNSDRIALWDLATGKQRYMIEQDLPSPECGAFSPDGRLLAIAGQGHDIVLFDTTNGKEQRRLHAHPTIESLAFSPDGKTLVSGDNSGCLALWDVAAGQRVPPSPEPFGPLWGLHFVAGGRQLRSFSDGLYWWDVASGRRIRHLPRDPAWRGPWSISPDGKILTTFVLKSDQESSVLVDTATGQPARTLAGDKVINFGSTFSPDGTKLFTTGGFEPRITIWDVATGKLLGNIKTHTKFVDRIVVSPDGRWLASATPAFEAEGDYDIRLWDTASGKLRHRLKPRGRVFEMVFSADSSRLLSAGAIPKSEREEEGTMQLWDITTGKELLAFTGHQGPAICVAMTSDDRMIATGSYDSTLRLWEMASGAERGRIVGHQNNVDSVAFSPDGRLLAASSRDAPAYLWDVYSRQITRPTVKISKEDRDKLWQQLTDSDAAKAFQAMCDLIARPDDAVAILEAGWKQTPRATPEQMRRWIRDLDSEQFNVRRQAGVQLERFAAGHEELLSKALEQTGSLEVRKRLEPILSRPNPERLRRIRMLEVLERIGTKQARRLLQSLARETGDPVLSKQATAGLRRLEQRLQNSARPEVNAENAAPP